MQALMEQSRNCVMRHLHLVLDTPSLDFMKKLNILISMALSAVIVVSAQADSRVTQFDEQADADALLNYLGSNESPELKMEMMRSVFRNERIGFVSLLFKNHFSFQDLFLVLNEAPESEFKNQVVLMMLRTDSGFWPIEPPIRFGSRPGNTENAVEPFVGMIRKHLPSVAIGEDLFSTKEKRLQLAKDLESAMAKEKSASEEGVQPKAEGMSPEEEADPLTAKTDPKSTPGGETPQSGVLNNPAFLVAITLGAIALVWFVVRLRGRR